jgi:uncharacterized RDD family membrane protein YckC
LLPIANAAKVKMASRTTVSPAPGKTMPFESATSPDEIIEPRAGFWRRFLAFVIDVIIVSLPFQVIGAILFVATSGWIQQSGGVTYTICAFIKTAPDGLAPPPPAGSNFARQCSVYFFGAETARRLQVGRVTKEGTTTKTVWRGYMLARNGHPIDGVSINWIVMVVFIAYLLVMERRTGATLGNLTMRIRVIEAAEPDYLGVPLRKIIFRYLVMLIGFVPLITVALVYGVRYGENLEAVADSDVFAWLQIAGIAGVGWGIFLTVPVVRKRDPLYDRIAGTAVVRI